MLTFFRRALSSWLVLGLFGLIMIAFIVTGIGTPARMGAGALSSLGGDGLASVGGIQISQAEVGDQVKRQMARIREQQPDLDVATFVRGGAIEEIINQLLTSKALNAFGHEQGLGASDTMVSSEIASIPGFQNVAGQFDNATYRAALARENITEKQLRDDISSSIIQRQLVLPVAGSPRFPSGVAFQYASLLLESRSGSIGIVPAAVMNGGPPPTDAEIQGFYKAQQARYAIPERRIIRYATFGAAEVAGSVKATDQEIAAFYNANAASYAGKETRTLSQVVLPDEAAARAFAAKLAAGTSFAQAAQQAGFGPADTLVGDQDKKAFAERTSAAVADAAFATARGATTAPTRSPLGWHIVRVDAVRAVPAKALATVRGEIAKQIEQQKMQEAIAALDGQIEDAISGGSTFDEVVKARHLTAQVSVPVTSSGAAPGTPGGQGPAELAPLLKGAFDLEPDDDPIVEPVTPGRTFAIVKVDRVIPAAPPPLAQIANQVQSDFAATRAATRAKAVAAAIVAKVNAGIAIRDAFAQAGVRLPPPQAVNARRIDISRQGQQVPPPLAMMFSMAKGKARLLAAPNGAGWFVVALEKIVPGNANSTPGLIEATRGQFARVVGEEYGAQFSKAIEAGTKIKRNDAAIARLKAQLIGGGGAE